MDPNAKSRQNTRSLLEQLVDQASYAEVLEDLGLIAHEKANHVMQAYGDKATARVWQTYATWTLKLCDRFTGSQLFAEKWH